MLVPCCATAFAAILRRCEGRPIFSKASLSSSFYIGNRQASASAADSRLRGPSFLTSWIVYKRRMETAERSFTDARQLHGHRYARFRTLNSVKWQRLMAAQAQNVKKIALMIANEPRLSPASRKPICPPKHPTNKAYKIKPRQI